jgi:hypothetical protein
MTLRCGLKKQGEWAWLGHLNAVMVLRVLQKVTNLLNYCATTYDPGALTSWNTKSHIRLVVETFLLCNYQLLKIGSALWR